VIRRRSIGRVLLVAALSTLGGRHAWAHAGPRQTDPVDGAMLGESPTEIRLSFSEKPEASLSIIRVLDANGAAYQTRRPEYAAGDPLSLSVPVRPLDRGVYIVSWRIVSAVDGHATTGAYAFGVRVAPSGAVPTAPADPPASFLEMAARWMLLAGLVALLGAAAAGLARFGCGRELVFGASGWLLAMAGAALLAGAQRQNADASFAGLMNTSVGRALLWRTAAIGCAGAALVLARSRRGKARDVAMIAAALAVLTTMAAHVAAGHAAAGGRWAPAAIIGVQWVHFAAIGIWFGGLAALLLGVTGSPSAEKAAATRRFSTIAGWCLLAVVGTGAARAVGELSSWRDLIDTAYGRMVAVKIAVIIAVAAIGAFNRWRGVPAAALNLRPLRRAGRSEIALAVVALAATSALGALPPPASLVSLPGLDASGIDYGTTVRVHLTAPSNQPGPNRFVVTAADYDSKAPMRPRRVSLLFAPLDDPDVAPTSLVLAPGPGESYAATGANLAFEGRWRITALIEGAGNSVEVPLDVETRSAPQFVSVLRVPGQSPEYTIEVKGKGRVRLALHPERGGRSEVYLTCFDGIFEDLPIDTVVFTAASRNRPARQLPARRLDRNRFVADIDLVSGSNRIAVIARTVDGSRLRAALDIPIE
jgi:copper transport protein